MKAQAIQTEYKGYKFRSRLEARWAVFFDAVGCEYEYEPEGYELEDGTKYLPDFYIPKYNLFVEIKPARATTETVQSEENIWQAHEKMRMLTQATGKNGIIINGTPGEKINCQLWPHTFDDESVNQWCLVKDALDAVTHPLIANGEHVSDVDKWYWPDRSIESLFKVKKYGGEINCPVCGFEYVHVLSTNQIEWGSDARFGVEVKMQCESAHSFTLCFGNYKGIGQWWINDIYELRWEPLLAFANFDDLLLELAQKRAKQARFEYGQTPSSKPIQIS